MVNQQDTCTWISFVLETSRVLLFPTTDFYKCFNFLSRVLRGSRFFLKVSLLNFERGRLELTPLSLTAVLSSQCGHRNVGLLPDCSFHRAFFQRRRCVCTEMNTLILIQLFSLYDNFLEPTSKEWSRQHINLSDYRLAKGFFPLLFSSGWKLSFFLNFFFSQFTYRYRRMLLWKSNSPRDIELIS